MDWITRGPLSLQHLVLLQLPTKIELSPEWEEERWLARWIREHPVADPLASLGQFAENGNIRAAQWIIEEHGITKFDVSMDNLRVVGSAMNAVVAGWFVEQFNITPADITPFRVEILERFIKNPNFRAEDLDSFVKFCQFDPTTLSEDQRATLFEHLAVPRRDLSKLQWGLDNLRVTARVVRELVKYMDAVTVPGAVIAVVKKFTTKFPELEDDLGFWKNVYHCGLCCNHLDLVRYASKKWDIRVCFGLAPDENAKYLILDLESRGHVRMITLVQELLKSDYEYSPAFAVKRMLYNNKVDELSRLSRDFLGEWPAPFGEAEAVRYYLEGLKIPYRPVIDDVISNAKNYYLDTAEYLYFKYFDELEEQLKSLRNSTKGCAFVRQLLMRGSKKFADSVLRLLHSPEEIHDGESLMASVCRDRTATNFFVIFYFFNFSESNLRFILKCAFRHCHRREVRYLVRSMNLSLLSFDNLEFDESMWFERRCSMILECVEKFNMPVEWFPEDGVKEIMRYCARDGHIRALAALDAVVPYKLEHDESFKFLLFTAAVGNGSIATLRYFFDTTCPTKIREWFAADDYYLAYRLLCESSSHRLLQECEPYIDFGAVRANNADFSTRIEHYVRCQQLRRAFGRDAEK